MLGFALAACVSEKNVAPNPWPPHPVPTQPGGALPVGTAPVATAPVQTAALGSGTSTDDAWRSSCAAISSCGACLNAPPCNWCAGQSTCVGPQTQCAELRVSESAACYTAPLRVAQTHHPELAERLARYEMVRETKSLSLAAFRQERFFLNAGDCFAVLSEPHGHEFVAGLHLQYAIQERGTPDPATLKPMPEPASGARGRRAALSPEFCPWEPVYLAVTWLMPSERAAGDFRLHLLRRTHPDPKQLAAQAAAAERAAAKSRPMRQPPRGGSCSDFECGEDCRSELRSCNLDCFRYGRHEMGSDRMCKAGCRQALRSCERSCRVACSR
jgi:hypothetical protein